MKGKLKKRERNIKRIGKKKEKHKKKERTEKERI